MGEKTLTDETFIQKMKDESKEADSFHPTVLNTYMQFTCTYKEHACVVSEEGALERCSVHL